jgi:ATPase
MKKITKLLPDSTVLIEGLITRQIKDGEIATDDLLIPQEVLFLLSYEAITNKTSGDLGLDELRALRDISKKHGFSISFVGKRPKESELKSKDFSWVNHAAIDLAYNEGAVLMTSDEISGKIAESKGVEVIICKSDAQGRPLLLDSYFTPDTMSVHIRENIQPFAKKGRPGNWTFEPIKKEQTEQKTIKLLAREIIEQSKLRRNAFIEIERPGSTIVQLGSYRIVITKPPFSDGWEITAVRPVKKLSLGDYELTGNLSLRIQEQAEGVLIAGSPGMGKSTFAAALAEYYAGMGKIVKTVEAPRDLVLPDTITQYAISHGDPQEIHDILLLSRPDYTFFDEMRNTQDFRLFADLRLAGIGFIGVVHATKAIDSIQRFVGRIELGIIPQVIDTVIFIKDGMVDKVLSLNMVVKVPSGMTESDLARPVVVVNDFETKKLEYEMYSYGEETVVVPVEEEKHSKPTWLLAKRQIEKQLSSLSDQIEVEVISDTRCVVYVPEENISRIIGKAGRTVSELEKKLGIGIDVKDLAERTSATGPIDSIDFDYKIMTKNIVFYLPQRYINSSVSIVVGEDYLLTAKVSKKAEIKVKKSNKIGKIIMNALNLKEPIALVEEHHP